MDFFKSKVNTLSTVDITIAPKQTEGFYIKLNSAFAFIFILVMIASGFGIYILYSLGKVINTTEKETFPATLAAMRLSERTALIAASAPALAAASNEEHIKNIYNEFEKHMSENQDDLQGVYTMGNPHTLTEIKESLKRVSVIETSLREMVKEKFILSKSRHEILDNLLKLQADLDDTLGPLIWGTTSLTQLLGKRTARIITQNIDKEDNDLGQIRSSINLFTDRALEPLQTALDIKTESALLISLLNMALHVATSDAIFPLETRASRSLNVFLQAVDQFHKGELAKRNPILSTNLNRIEKSFTGIKKGELSPFDIRRKELEKEEEIISLLNQGRQEAKTLSQEVEIIVRQMQENLHHQAGLVSKYRLTGVTILGVICLVSLLLSTIVAMLTTRALRNRDTAIQQAVVEAERANRIKSQFIANMSHEIRTPMNSVLGFLELVLEDDSLTSEQHQQLAIAHASAKGLLSLINDILDMNKLESGKVIIEYGQFSLIRLIEQTFEIMNIKAREKGLGLFHHIHESLYSVFSGDALRIRQVIINLLGNAIKFTNKGYVTLKVTPNGTVGDAILLLFSIEDTGIGIASDNLQNIFEPFTQADSSTTRKYGGTGLGITISKQLVELMGGQIWVESEESKGSIFHFTIPLVKVDDPLINPSAESIIFSGSITSLSSLNNAQYKKIDNSLKSKEQLNKNRGYGRSLKILVAEDVEANALLVKTRLTLQGHTVTIAKSGKEAVRAFEQERFDIILMDVHMPEMDGLEATTRIRQIEMETKEHIPIIALTASVMKEEIKTFLETGMDFFVGKPIDFNELAKVMNKYISLPQNEEKEESDYLHNQEKTIGTELLSGEVEISDNINFEEGIYRWQDKALYVSSLVQFADKYVEIISIISALINGNFNVYSDLPNKIGAEDTPQKQYLPSQEQIEKAYEITHTIKGAASNLALTKVAAIAEKLNSALYKCRIDKNKNSENQQNNLNLEDTRKNLNLLSKVLQSAFEEIQILKISALASFASSEYNLHQKKRVESEKSICTISNMKEINKIISELQECVKQYSPDGIEELLDKLERYISPHYLQAIRKYIDDFNFVGAEKELDKLRVCLDMGRNPIFFSSDSLKNH